MARARVVYRCEACDQQVGRWVGRCPGCGAWGTVVEAPAVDGAGSLTPVELLDVPEQHDVRATTGFPGLDRALGGGLVPASVVLVAGEPGIGKSTLVLHVVAHLAAEGRRCLLASGEESHAQVAARARRLGVGADGRLSVRFAPGRDLDQVLETARADRPFLLAVDSIQTLRDPDGSQAPGGVAQVRAAADALVGLAKSAGITVLLTGHVTKEGDLAGPRALEHAVDTVLTFDGDPRSGLRVLACGKNRFGAEGEAAWFEMSPLGLHEIEPGDLLVSRERVAGSATSLPRMGRRALAVEVQALVGSGDGVGRRQATGLDPRRFQLVAAVLDRVTGLRLARSDLYGATTGGVRLDDPAGDLAVAAALASASTGIPAPDATAFVGEIALTGLVRPVTGIEGRLMAARAVGCSVVVAPRASAPAEGESGQDVIGVRDVREALAWAFRPSAATDLRPSA